MATPSGSVRVERENDRKSKLRARSSLSSALETNFNNLNVPTNRETACKAVFCNSRHETVHTIGWVGRLGRYFETEGGSGARFEIICERCGVSGERNKFPTTRERLTELSRPRGGVVERTTCTHFDR